MASMGDRIREEVEKHKKAAAVKAAVQKMGAGVAANSALAAMIKARQQGGSTSK